MKCITRRIPSHLQDEVLCPRFPTTWIAVLPSLWPTGCSVSDNGRSVVSWEVFRVGQELMRIALRAASRRIIRRRPMVVSFYKGFLCNSDASKRRRRRSSWCSSGWRMPWISVTTLEFITDGVHIPGRSELVRSIRLEVRDVVWRLFGMKNRRIH